MARKLLNLASDNRGKGTGLRLEADTGTDTTTIFVYDTIDAWWGISAADFARQLAAVSTSNVTLRINSPGGDVFEARAMMAAIAEHGATFTAKIDGLAASAATLLTLPCDSVEIVEGGFYMIHNAWTIAMGDADDMTATADLLTKIDAVIAQGYARKSGKSADEIAQMMDDETWLEAAEAVAAGFCDSIVPIGAEVASNRASNRFNLSVFDHAPKALIAPPADETIDPAVVDTMKARLALYERTGR